MQRREKIVIKTVTRPAKEDPQSLADWFCDSLGLTGNGEDDPDLFRELVSNSLNGEGITSKTLSEDLEMPRSTVIYKLNDFIDSGLAIRKGRRYFLRGDDLVTTLEELQADMERDFERMMKLASKFDEIMEGEIYDRRKRRRRE